MSNKSQLTGGQLLRLTSWFFTGNMHKVSVMKFWEGQGTTEDFAYKAAKKITRKEYRELKKQYPELL